MHYYQHHIGDFIRDTSRLTDSQSMAYLRLLWMYYESESPLPDMADVLALKVGSETETVSLLLRAFFRLEDGVWKHSRCDREIAEYHQILERNRHNGKLGGRPKKTQSVLSGFPVGSQSVSSGFPVETQTEPNGNPVVTLTSKPITSNQEPVTNNQEKHAPSAAAPSDPLDFIWSVGVQILGDKGRSLLGKARKELGDQKVTEILAQMASMKPPVSDPIPYFIKATKPQERRFVP